MSTTLELAKQLIAKPSITPEDAGCQDLLMDRLADLGFRAEPFNEQDVSNFFARRGHAAPLLVFAGHTDVVPPGPTDTWETDPFTPEIRNGRLYGRGAADMKGSLAAMITALERFVKRHPHHKGSIGMLVTSDEEGPAVHGTVKVVEALRERGDLINWCVVGEPTAETTVGDTVKNGRRGSLHGRLTVLGMQGHVAYPEYARNPIHESTRALDELCRMEWDSGSKDFPPTTFQISNVKAGTGATNVIPGHMEVTFNFRYCPASAPMDLKKRVEGILSQHRLDYRIEWELSGEPYVTGSGELLDATQEAVKAVTGKSPQVSTSGGTSDGRFIAKQGAQVVEVGPVNESIHQANEWIDIDELETLADIYENILERLLGG